MKTYKLIKDDITIIEIDNKNFVIDTGLPFSFSYNKEMSLIIEGQTYHLNKNDILSDIFRNLDIEIEGIIGLDIINKQDGLTIDKENHIFSFASLKRDTSITKSLNNLCISATISGIKANKVYLDTAAVNDIVSSDFAKNLNKIKTIKQSTTLGMIDFDVYNIEISLLNTNKINETLVLPSNLSSQIPFDGIINPNKFYSKYLSLDFKNNNINFE